MKRLAILLILISGAYQLKAQRAEAKAADSLLKYLKPQADVGKLLQKNLALNETLALNDVKTNPVLITQSFRSTMPIAVLEGYSKMPVAKLQGYDNMPVVRVNPDEAGLLKQQALPRLPAFKAPAALSPAPQK